MVGPTSAPLGRHDWTLKSAHLLAQPPVRIILTRELLVLQSYAPSLSCSVAPAVHVLWVNMVWGLFKEAAPPPPPPPPPVVPRSGPEIDTTTVASLLGVVALLAGAYAISTKALPRTASLKIRILFIWHLFDALIHFVFEGSFLWNCFFVSYALPRSFAAQKGMQVTLFTPPDVYWLGIEDRVYGANYGAGPASRLWQEYAKADRRWGGTDLTVISLELLTVFVAGPLALWICWSLRGDERKGTLRKWFWMIVLATGEIYGGE